MSRITPKYLERIQEFPLRPIRSDSKLERATVVMHELLDADRLTAAEQDYLEILGDLIEKYEKQHHRIEPLAPHQMLAMSMQSKGVTQSELAHATGIPVSTISELLSQKRAFNVSHIAKLSAYFRLDPAAFIPVRPEETVKT